MPFSMDSNSTQAYYAEETTLGVQAAGPYTPLEPNSYSTWGVNVKTVARATLNATRQQQKGTITEADVAAGFQSDYTQTNLLKLLQGFFFADLIQKPTSNPINGTKTAINSVSTTAVTAAAAITGIEAKHIIALKGFGVPSNNAPAVVSAVASGVITAAPLAGGTFTAEAAPPTNAEVHVVGIQLINTATLAGLTTAAPTLVDASGDTDFTTLGLNIGEWIYIGDTGTTSSFTGATSGTILRGYARISAIAAHQLTFDFITFGGTGDATAAATGAAHVNVYFGSYLMNQVPTLIKRRSYTMARYLGKGVNNTDQLEVLLGCVADKLTLNINQASKVTADLTWVGIAPEYQNQTAASLGTLLAPFNEKAINTSQDLFATLLTIVGTDNASLFAYSTDATFDIDNSTTVTKALGSEYGFDVTTGDFKTSYKGTAYFDDIAAIEAIQANNDCGAVTILAARNAGSVVDIPLLTLGGGELKLEKDKKVMVDVTGDGAENANGYTMSYTHFSYLPASAVAGYKG